MNSGLKLFCTDCLASLDLPPTDFGSQANRPTSCPHCGGPVQAAYLTDSKEFETPLSLALTPEEPSWSVESATSQAGTSIGASAMVRALGRFQLRERLGGGGFGDVFRAYDPRLDREVALKVLRDAHPTARLMERFFREARAASRLDHPNIIAVHDAGRDDGRCWIAYQFVNGSSLESFRRDSADSSEPPNITRAATICRDIADALHHAHQNGVVHRDVKPSNIILDDFGRPRLTDFGLARRLDSEPTLTIEGTVLGTPVYMSPEQASGNSHKADHRSDVYALGVILQELLCGRPDSSLPSNMPAWRAASLDPPPPPRTIDRRVPRALDSICRAALARDPNDRYPSAACFRDDLDSWIRARERTRLLPLKSLAVACLIAIAILFCLLAGSRLQPIGLAQTQTHVEAQTQTNRTSHARASEPLPPAPSKPATTPARKSLSIRLPHQFKVAIFLGNDETKLFHVSSCGALKNLSLEQLTPFPSRQEAIDQGFRPCHLCCKESLKKP